MRSSKSLHRFDSAIVTSMPFDIPLPEIDSILAAPAPVSTSAPNEKSNNKDNNNNVNFDIKATTPFPIIPFKGSIPHISPETFDKILCGSFKDKFDSIHIIDCRFEYEHKGGHIIGAINSNDPEILKKKFFNQPMDKALIIFHCEFSQNRGPEVASIFRSIDRKLNKDIYPHLHYPHVYILHGGYKEFYGNFPNWCDGGYTKMVNPEARTNGDLQSANSLYNENIKKAKEDIQTVEVAKRRFSCIDPGFLDDPVSPIIRHNQSRFDSGLQMFDIPL